jgi:ribulose bisphosphate carboxylase small subunit
MLKIQDYIENLSFLISKYGFSLTQNELPENFNAVYFSNVNRRIDLIFHYNGNLIRTYILNTEEKTPSYKDNDNCINIETLDLIKGTTIKNHNKYWGKNRKPGVYELTDEQQLKDLRDILLDNKKVFRGKRWPTQDYLNKLHSNRNGYKATHGWKPDPQLTRIKKNLDFLFEIGYEKIFDHDDKPEYQSFAWEKTVIFENKRTGHAISIEVDYRGQCDTMCFKNQGEWTVREKTDYDKIKKIVSTTPNNKYT